MVGSELAFLLTRGVSLRRRCQVRVAVEHIVEDVALIVLTGDPADVLEVAGGGCLRPRVEKLVDFVLGSFVMDTARSLKSQSFEFCSDMVHIML